jgi:hypothetical protein
MLPLAVPESSQHLITAHQQQHCPPTPGMLLIWSSTHTGPHTQGKRKRGRGSTSLETKGSRGQGASCTS